MRTFIRTWLILSLLGLSYAGDSVNILTPGGLRKTFEEDEILHVLSHNKTETTKNFTFVELINSLSNFTVETEKNIWNIDKPEVHYTNPYYGKH